MQQEFLRPAGDAVAWLDELGARFEPHEYPYLRVSVAATLEAEGRRAQGRFGHARAGLPLECVGGVLAGAFQEPGMVGPGTLTFDHAAVHEIDSSWEVFRLLAIGVVRLLGLPSGDTIPMDLLPDSVAPNRHHLVRTEAYSSATMRTSCATAPGSHWRQLLAVIDPRD